MNIFTKNYSEQKTDFFWQFFRIAKYSLTYWGMLKLNNYGVRSYSLYNLVSCLPVLQQCHLNFLLVSSKFSWLLFWYVCSLVYAQWFDLSWIGGIENHWFHGSRHVQATDVNILDQYQLFEYHIPGTLPITTLLTSFSLREVLP